MVTSAQPAQGPPTRKVQRACLVACELALSSPPVGNSGILTKVATD